MIYDIAEWMQKNDFQFSDLTLLPSNKGCGVQIFCSKNKCLYDFEAVAQKVEVRTQ